MVSRSNNCHLLVRLQAFQILVLVVFIYLILDENSDIIVKAGYLDLMKFFVYIVNVGRYTDLFATLQPPNIRIRILQIFVLIFFMNLQHTISGKY